MLRLHDGHLESKTAILILKKSLKKLTYNENKSVIIYVKNNLQHSDHVFRSPFSDTWMK